MRLLILGGIGIVACIGVCVLIGFMLPQGHTASRAAQFSQPPEQLFALISGPQGWRAGLTKVEELPSTGGRRTWREYSGRNSITFEEVASDPPRLYSTRIVGKNLPFGGTWIWQLTPNGSGTEVRITENGEAYNPVFRFVSRFIMGYTKTIDGYLQALGNQFHETIAIHN